MQKKEHKITNRSYKINIDNDRLKHFNSIFVEFEVFDSYEVIKKGKSYTSIRIHVVDNSIPEYKIGMLIERVQNKLKFKSLSGEEKIIKLRFKGNIAKQLRRDYKKELRIGTIISGSSGKSLLEFNVSDCETRDDLVIRIARIFDIVNEIKFGLIHSKDMIEFEKFVSHFNKFGNMKKTHESFEVMTGRELIDKGHAVIVSGHRYTRFIDRVLRMFNSDLEYYYFDKVVDLNKEYYVKLDRPIGIDPVIINWRKELETRFVYGEHIMRGLGWKEIDLFQKEIIEVHNKHIDKNRHDTDMENKNNVNGE